MLHSQAYYGIQLYIKGEKSQIYEIDHNLDRLIQKQTLFDIITIKVQPQLPDLSTEKVRGLDSDVWQKRSFRRLRTFGDDKYYVSQKLLYEQFFCARYSA